MSLHQIALEVLPDIVVRQRRTNLDPTHLMLVEHKRAIPSDKARGLVHQSQRYLYRIFEHRNMFAHLTDMTNNQRRHLCPYYY